MDMFIFIIGFLAILVGLVLLVFNLIKKRPVKKYGITMLVGLVLAITGLFMPMKDDSTLTGQDSEKKEIQDEGEVEEVTPYSKEIEQIDGNISDTFKGKNYNIEIEGEEGDYEVSIALDADDDRFLESIWCGSNGLDFLEGMKEYQPELDKNINTYELLFFAEDSQTYSSKVDNSDSNEIKKLDLVSEESGEVVIVTTEDVEKFHGAEKERKEREEAERKEQEQEKYNTGITVKDMARDKDGLAGSLVTFSGKIIQIMQGDGYNQYRMAVDDDYDQVILIEISDDQLETNILEDDFITIQGVSFGNVEYETVMGAKQSVPGVIVDNFTLN